MACPLADLPVEVLLDHLLPSLPVADLLALTCTSRRFADLSADDTFWRRKLLDDFNFSGEGTARTSGWKFIYRGLAHPRAFVWGDKSKSRLGLSESQLQKFRKGVPYPVQIHLPGKRIVSLAPGGWSFHALDSQGDVYVWGTLDATMMGLRSDGFAEANKEAHTPIKLRLPSPIRSISCGRAHALVLAASGVIYTFHCWGRPYKLSSQLLNTRHGDGAIKQIEAGWAFCAALTNAGNVIVWWPGSGPLLVAYDAARESLNQRANMGEEELRARPTEDMKEIPCHVFELGVEPVQLDDLPPDLPDLPLEEGEKRAVSTRIIKIAGADNTLIALTNGGHVLRYTNLTSEAEYQQGRWEYLPNFSEVETLHKLEAFQKAEDDKDYIKTPKFMRITHISAHFNSFVAYSTGSSSIVLMGKVDSPIDASPKVIPALQHKDVIAVVLGDYHSGALTSAGRLLTWGSFSAGALGLGDPAQLPVGAPGGYDDERHRQRALDRGYGADPPPVEVPTEVRFGRGEKFAFLAAAAGWHMGALVLDLDDTDDTPEPVEEEHVDMPGSYNPLPVHEPTGIIPHPFPNRAPGQIPNLPMLRGHPRAFRVGLAGARGRGQGNHNPEQQQ